MKYPIYIPSKGRAATQKTVKLLLDNKIENFYVVVEANDYKEYCKYVNSDRLLKLPSSSYGTSVVARNFCIEHSLKKGFKKHWQFDDDINKIFCHDKSITIHKRVADILITMEQLSDKNAICGVIGMRTANFLKSVTVSIRYNTSLTSLFLITNSSLRFRGTMYVDMDYQLQVLKRGMQTMKCEDYAFVFQTPMKHKGGYYDIYSNDNRRTAAINEFLKFNPDLKHLTIERNTQGFLALKNFGRVWRKYKL
jgi:hypothetical protein